MYVSPTTEQTELRSNVARLLQREAPVSVARELLNNDKGYDYGLWLRMADELGLQGLLIPNEYDGAGASFLEMALVLEEMGHHLLSAPFFASAVLATQALLDSGDTAAMAQFLPPIAAGAIATLAMPTSSEQRRREYRTPRAAHSPNGYTLTGEAAFVLDGMSADVLLVAGRTDAGLTLLAVEATAAGLSRTPMPVLDGTRRMARVEFDCTPAQLIGVDGGAAEPLRRTLDKAAIALGAEQLGGAQRCLDMAVDYAKTRTAFGRPIGSFQTIKHKCAEMYLAIESARCTIRHAAWVVATNDEQLNFVAAATKALMSEVYVDAAQQNVQIHGAIGFTWDHDAHLYLRRARSTHELFGSPHHHLAKIADHLDM